MIFGVNSVDPANIKLTNGYDLFTWVMRKSSPPSFWGRNISGNNRLTRDEVNFLHGKYCNVALIFDELTEAKVSIAFGYADGMRAVTAAKGLGVPDDRRIALFVEIKDDWSVNHNWMLGYAHTLLSNGYLPGFIGNTDSSKNFNFGRQCSHYVQFMHAVAREYTVYWATEPKEEGEPSEWSPYCPSELTPEKIDLWHNGDMIKYGDMNIKQNYARDESIIRFMW